MKLTAPQNNSKILTKTPFCSLFNCFLHQAFLLHYTNCLKRSLWMLAQSIQMVVNWFLFNVGVRIHQSDQTSLLGENNRHQIRNWWNRIVERHDCFQNEIDFVRKQKSKVIYVRYFIFHTENQQHSIYRYQQGRWLWLWCLFIVRM